MSFAGAVVFRAGRQLELHATFDWSGLRFPADWHGSGGRIFLSVEVLSHRREPYRAPLRRLSLSTVPSWARLIPYSGFCVGHALVEPSAEAEDHVFYRAGPHDVRGVEAIVEGRTRSECRRRMTELLDGRDVARFVEASYARAGQESPFVQVRRSGIEGTGVFARRRLAPGTLLEAVSRPLVRYARVPREGEDGYGHCIQAQRGWWLLLDHSPFYFLNHACEANTKVDLRGATITVETTRDVAAGEELTLDYATVIFQDDPYSFRCGCGGKRCRGWIRGTRR